MTATIYAHRHEDAAEQYGEDYDCGGDYTIVGGDEITVKVRKVGEDEWKTFTVSGESVPQYNATEQ